MKKNTFLGIGTIIVTDEIVVAYVDVILDIIKNGGVTFDDTKNICETLMYLRDNYKGNEAAQSYLNKVASCVHTLYLENTVVDIDADDVFMGLLAVKAILV